MRQNRRRRSPLVVVRASFRLFVGLAVVVAAMTAGFWPRLARADQPLTREEVPDPLKPWVPWVLHDREAERCPRVQVQGGTTNCAWPTRLELTLTDKGGDFAQAWRADANVDVFLPGDERRWPQDVTVDGKRAVVVSREGRPSVSLLRGTHRVVGKFVWDSLPESLRIPPETGLLALAVRGKSVDAPNRGGDGMVWLQKAAQAEEGDALEVVVHRKVEDDVPLRLTTHIQLAISGKNREIVLGKALPPGFVPTLLSSSLPARVEPDSRIRIQARAGTHVLELVARSEGPISTLERPAPDGPWREGDEVWVFQSRPELRVVEVEGVSAIDPQQTNLPDQWKTLPAYPMKLGAKLSLSEKRRGDADPPADQLNLERRMWLDFDGHGLTISDHITGTLSRSTRLEMQKPTSLGRVAIRGKDQFITQLGDAASLGVEIRQGDLDVIADSRLAKDADATSLPAVGWNHDFSRASATLLVPPGFRIFHVSGVDEVPGTWIRHWTLLEIFLVLVLALATARLFGVGWGLVAMVTLVLTIPESDAPKWIWAVMLGFIALVRVLPQGRVRRVFAGAELAVALLLVIVTIPFLIQHVREGIYPALGRSQQVSAASGVFDELSQSKREQAPSAAVAVPEPQAALKDDKNAADVPAPGSPPVEEKAAPLGGEAAKERGAGTARPTGNAAPKSDSSASYGRLARAEKSQLNVDVYDPNAMVQTGPGLPAWNWSALDLRWSGPVERSQTLHLWALGPFGNLALAFLRAALLVALLLRMMPFFDRMVRLGRGDPANPGGGSRRSRASGALTLMLLVAVGVAAPRAARADSSPDKEILEELQKRLLATATCTPSCASSSRLALDVQGGSLRGRIAIDAAADVAVPLPGSATQWLPARVEVDGKAATGLLARDGKLFVALEAGSHDLVIEGPLPSRETVQIALPLKPKRVEATTRGWKLDGVHEDGLSDDNLQLTRIASESGGEAALETTALPPFVSIERTLRIGLSWQVETRVVRASPPGTAIVLEVPLLPGESVTTADVRVVQGKVLVNLPPQSQETTWKSVLESKSPLVLAAPKGLPWVETWRLDLSPIWHASFEGIPAVHPGAKRFASMPEWRPWPGESLSLDISRPSGAAGQTLTIDESRLEMRPGLRSTDATLTLKARSSRGGQHVVTLPAGAVLQQLQIGNVPQPLRQEGANVAIPITPGFQEIQLVWREPRGVTSHFVASPIDLHLATVNATVVIALSDARWVLFASGPRLGPAVLFWSLLLVLIVIALALSRVSFVPLGVGAWLLLAIGLSQVPVVAAAIVVAWLVALGARARYVDLDVAWFDLRQIALVFLTLAALTVLVVAVHQGLLGSPDMQIEGNGSSAWDLRWFADRAENMLPQPSVVSVPIFVYRAAMLAWALWLALSVLKWLRFGWQAFSSGGFWRSSPREARPRWAPGAGGPPAGYPGAMPAPWPHQPPAGVQPAETASPVPAPSAPAAGQAGDALENGPLPSPPSTEAPERAQEMPLVPGDPDDQGGHGQGT